MVLDSSALKPSQPLLGGSWVVIRVPLRVPLKGSKGFYKSIGFRGGSWVVTSGGISPLIRVISVVTLVITLLITTHEPPSKP